MPLKNWFRPPAPQVETIRYCAVNHNGFTKEVVVAYTYLYYDVGILLPLKGYLQKENNNHVLLDINAINLYDWR